ncbi:MAG: arylamine N-acetyltransferase family protein, partial [Caulobacteraceae bacterium]
MADLSFDLDAYLARIGYGGPREASLQVLRDVHRLHAAAIAFENLSSLMEAPVPLALPDLQA